MVKDASGGAVVNAHVQITSVERTATAVSASGKSGDFAFSDVSCGVWSLSVKANGFRNARATLPVLDVNQTVQTNITLTVESQSETVRVASSIAPQATYRNITERRIVTGMPLNGRQYLDLALLTPGLIPAAPGTQGSGFNFAGIRSQSNVYLLDGISNIDTQTNQPLNLFRITDAVEEFDVETAARPAESGRGAGAQVNVITRSGTSELHGSAFEYLRNTALNASDFFTNKTGGTKAALNRNQFGVSAGGPLTRSNTWFFGSWEAFRQVSHLVSSTVVPTDAQRATVTDPIAQKLLVFWPRPNAPGTLNYISNVRNTDSDNTGLVRMDRTLTQRDRLSSRWTQYWGESTTAGATSLSGGNTGPIAQLSATIDEVHVFSPAIINNVRAGLSRYVVSRLPQDSGLNAAALFTTSSGAPLPGVVDATRDPVNSGLPTIMVGGGFAGLGTNANFPQRRVSNTVELFDDVTIIRAAGSMRHTLRAGFTVRREDLSRFLNRAERGTINFSNFADFAKGQINTSTFRTGSTQAYWRRYPWALYAQDGIRVRTNLELSLGIRYEYPSAVAELRSHAVNFIPGYGPMISGTNQVLDIDATRTGASSLVFRNAPFTLPASGVSADHNNLAPSVGFAWNPRAGATVIRGGFRMAYDDLFNNVPSAMALNAPFNLQTTQTANVTQPGKFTWATAFDQNVPLVANSGRQGPGTPATGVLTFQGADQNLRSAYAYIYDLGVQRALGRFIAVEAEYVGSSGHRLGIYTDLNQPDVTVRDATRRGTVAPNEQVYPYPHFGQVQIARSIGSSNYNGAIAAAKFRARHSMLQVSYTAGKSLDYNSSYFGSGNLPGETGSPTDSRNLRLEHGPSAFDVRHRLLIVGTFDSPDLAGQPALARIALRGWHISAVGTVQSGSPFTVVTGGPDASGFNQSVSGISPQGGNRPNIVKTGSLPQNNSEPDAAFDTTWFAANTAGQNGTSGRNQYYGPGLANIDLSLARDIHPLHSETAALQFRADFFNLLNHTNFANPVADLSNAAFGRITQTLGSAIGTSAGTSGGATGGPRVLQFSLRLSF